jgi:hypothetical protein
MQSRRQVMSERTQPPNGAAQRRSRSARGRPTPGRRRTDYDPRATISRKLVVLTVVIANALYLAGEALLFSGTVCP